MNLAHGAGSDIMIVGGSLVGLSAAITFARSGHHVTVLERARRTRQAVGAVRLDDDRLRGVISEDNATHQDAVAPAARPKRDEEHAALWTDVHERLAFTAEYQPNLTLLHETQVVEVGQDADTVWAVTDSGATLRASMLVGADGPRSLVRRAVAPDYPDAASTGYGVWYGTATEADRLHVGTRPSGLELMDRGHQVLLGFPLDDPFTEPGAIGWGLGWTWYGSVDGLFPGPRVPYGCSDRDALTPESVDDALREQLISEAERRWPLLWQAAIATSIREQRVGGIAVLDYLPVKLANGRMVLIGEAVHATTPLSGRGISVSLEDIDALSWHMRSVRERGVLAVLSEYEHERLPAAQELVRNDRRLRCHIER